MAEILPEKFGIAFDGWSEDGEHWVAFFAVCPNQQSYLLAFEPTPDTENGQSSLGSSAYKSLLEATLQSYEKRLDDVLFLCGDNCNTNKALANLCQLPLVGCASHRLNLAVSLIFRRYINEILYFLLLSLSTYDITYNS